MGPVEKLLRKHGERPGNLESLPLQALSYLQFVARGVLKGAAKELNVYPADHMPDVYSEAIQAAAALGL